MKLDLINKKTGEIGYLIVGKGSNHYVVTNNLWESCGEYNSLAELNEEWEDYEEPKDYYVINLWGEISVEGGKYQRPGLSELGLTFETKEDAEKAVEKLKAWKRLRDNGFKFTDWYRDVCEVSIQAEIHDEGTMGMINDLDILFGGEE